MFKSYKEKLNWMKSCSWKSFIAKGIHVETSEFVSMPASIANQSIYQLDYILKSTRYAIKWLIIIICNMLPVLFVSKGPALVCLHKDIRQQPYQLQYVWHLCCLHSNLCHASGPRSGTTWLLPSRCSLLAAPGEAKPIFFAADCIL